MHKLKLGGIKVLEKRAYLTSFCRSGDSGLQDVCSRLTADRINLNLLTHIAEDGALQSVTSACTQSSDGSSSYVGWKSIFGECNVGEMPTNICAISVFPHDQKPGVAGSLMGALAANGIAPYGFASSPSAVTALVASPDFQRTIEAIFERFEFPAYSSPMDWHAAYQGHEELLNRVICSFHEEIIRVYDFTRRTGLDLWTLKLPLKSIGLLGEALLELSASGIGMPFLVANTLPGAANTCLSFSMESVHHETVAAALDRVLPGISPRRTSPVSVLFLHGPHFGDRYGIANVLVKSLRYAGVSPLALSCATSSISLVVHGAELNQALDAIKSGFQIPARTSWRVAG